LFTYSDAHYSVIEARLCTASNVKPGSLTAYDEVAFTSAVLGFYFLHLKLYHISQGNRIMDQWEVGKCVVGAIFPDTFSTLSYSISNQMIPVRSGHDQISTTSFLSLASITTY
jgi:hypothetical protein